MKRKESSILACDLGFSSMKWKYGDQKGRIISAYQHPITPNESYILGEKALVQSGSRCINAPDELIEYYPRFVCEAMLQAKVSEPVTLALGLPYDLYLTESTLAPQKFSTIEKLKQACKLNLVKQVFVFPTGLGCIRRFLQKENLANGNMLGIDVGFNVVTLLLFSPKDHQVIYGSTYYRMGMRQVVDSFLKNISGKLSGKSLTPVEFNYKIERKTEWHRFYRKHLWNDYHNAAYFYIQNLLSSLMHELHANLGCAAEIAEVLIFGGGARFICEFPEPIKTTVLLDPEFANTYGLETLAQLRLVAFARDEAEKCDED